MPTLQDELNKVIDDHLKRTATRDELKAVVDTVGRYTQDLKVALEKKVDLSNEALKKETERIGREAAEVEKRLRKVFAGVEMTMSKKLESAQNSLQLDIDAVDSKISHYDDGEVRQLLNDIDKRLNGIKIPEKFDATDLVESLNRMNDRIAKVESRPTGTGGGVRRVFQPYLDRFQGDGSTKTWYLKREPLRTDNIEVWCTDFPIVLDPENDFTVTGKALTFTSEVNAPTNGAIIVVKFYA